MSNDLATWLRLREGADHRARSAHAVDMLARATAGGAPWHVLDLATGTGSNIRFLAERLPAPQRWLAVDHDETLLALVPVRMAAWGAARGCAVRTHLDACALTGNGIDCLVETRRMDLGRLDEAAIFTGRHLVTASALLDLVSESWLQVLAEHCYRARAATLFALTYNGRSRCTPREPEDDLVLDLFNRHQTTDKGLGGAAAGPGAVECAARSFAAHGYEVRRKASDWRLGPADRELQRQLILGWEHAAREMAPERAAALAAWCARRLEHVERGRSHIIVGHEDLVAWLPQDQASG
jgi:hypothetical protein